MQLGESLLRQRTRDAVLARRRRAGPKVAEVVCIRAIDHRIEPARLRCRNEPAPELGLTVVAPVARIGGIARVVELGGVDLQDPNVEATRDVASGGPLLRRIGRASTDDRQRTIGPEQLTSRHRQVGRVHATTVSDGDGRVGAKPRSSAAVFADRSDSGIASRSSAMTVSKLSAVPAPRQSDSARRRQPRRESAPLHGRSGVAIQGRRRALCRFSASASIAVRLPFSSPLRVDRGMRPLRWAGRDLRLDVPALRTSGRQPWCRVGWRHSGLRVAKKGLDEPGDAPHGDRTDRRRWSGRRFLLSHLSRATSAHQADDQEEMCRMIEEAGEEEYPGQLADCFKKLSQMRAAERGRDAFQTRALDSVRLSP